MNSVLSEYEASLAELSFNSKPLINMLTVLAEENVNYASNIVRIIESRLAKVQFKRKMPVMYLIDSIVKNFGDVYMSLFSRNLITNFLNVFEKADGKTRGDLYKLRSTWDNTFSTKLLHKLDLTIRTLDHNWPMRRKRKLSKSRNPLSLGDSPPLQNISTDEEKPADVATTIHEEVFVEEEEIEMDEEALALLEEKLKKRQAELSRLEYLESTQVEDPYQPQNRVEEPPDTIEKVGSERGNNHEDEEDDALKIDLEEYPVIPMETMHHDINQEDPKPNRVGDLDVDHWASHGSSFEPRTKRRNENIFQELNKNRVISHFEEPTTSEAKPAENPSPKPVAASFTETATQTTTIETSDNSVQNSTEVKDESTQYRYRKKTKNFMSQYKVPTKTIGTYFKLKMKDSETQYEPPSVGSQDTAADSTCLLMDEDMSSCAPSTTKESQNQHSLHILQSMQKQRDLGILCDITLAAQGEMFKAHKALLSACSDFFQTLFASEEIKQTPLSFIKLQGITASALSLVLDYIYTSQVVVSGNIKSVHEIITAAKRLKIHSLFPVCEVLEEALADDQDMTGWVISNTELIAPNENPLEVKHIPFDDESHYIASPPPVKSPSVEDADVKEVKQAGKKLKRSASEFVKNHKSVKRKERSSSFAESTGKKVKQEPEKTHHCRFCSKKFWKEKNLRFHVKKFHEAESEAAIETKEANRVTNDANNNNNVAKDTTHICEICSRPFKSASQLSNHTKKVHKVTPNAGEAEGGAGDAHVVDIKPVKDNAPKNATERKPTEAADDDPSKLKMKIYQCDLCEEIFSVQCFYKAHMASHRQNAEIGML